MCVRAWRVKCTLLRQSHQLYLLLITYMYYMYMYTLSFGLFHGLFHEWYVHVYTFEIHGINIFIFVCS